MPVKDNIAKGRALLWTDALEPRARQQVANLTALGFLHGHVAVMPDAHWGKGTTVGSVIPTKEAIIPAAVGVDLGCGMMAVETSLRAENLPDSLRPARERIEREVPVGSAARADDAQFAKAPGASSIARRAEPFEGLLPKKWLRQMGTLGGGNHFIEVCLDERDRVWAMLHSGSRGAGNAIGRHWIAVAKREMERFCVHLPDADLAYLREGSPSFDAYVQAVGWAQDYARANRELMMRLVLKAMRESLGPFETTGQAVNCHHNYVEALDSSGSPTTNFSRRRADTWLTRKGAISARKGELGIVPGSMGTKSYIVEGLGNARSHWSSSHGAGRRLSRTAAKEQFGLDDFRRQTAGVECRREERFIDEIPAAYKDIDEVMAQQADLTRPLHELRAVLCVKG